MVRRNEMTNYKQIFIINNDLKMGKGKIAVQCCHGEVLFLECVFELRYHIKAIDEKYDAWRQENIKPIGTMTKVVLKASENEMMSLCETMNRHEINHFKVFDLGKTQIEAGILTCVCVEPLDEVQCDALFGHLKLL